MDQRKLIQHGLSSLTVAVPMKWVRNHGLKKGDSLFVQEEGNSVIMRTAAPLATGKISIEVTLLDRTSILLYVQSLYRFGYDEITVTFQKPTARHYRTKVETGISAVVHQTVNRLIGMEVVEESRNRIVIKALAREAEEDFTVILRRIFLLLTETTDTLIEGLRTQDFPLLETVENKHDNISKFVNYALRLLNRYGYPDVKKTCFYYHIIASIDKIVDVLKYLARDALVEKRKFGKDALQLLGQINASLRLYTKFFYQFNLETVNALSENRDAVKHDLRVKLRKMPAEDLYAVARMAQILEILLDLTDFRMGLEY